jgi:uncharacterized protein (DUF1684 family)
VPDPNSAEPPEAISAQSILDLLDWKRRIFALYSQVRESKDPYQAWTRWREVRDEMFADHPQSPLPSDQRTSFRGLAYFDYNPEARVLAEVTQAEPQPLFIEASTGGSVEFTRFGVASFELHGNPLELELYWLDAYGGGLFLSFRDSTSGKTSYGAGRYLLDTVKGADLGSEDDRLVLDFNFAYAPSCAYDPRWVCPLVPPPNRLFIPIEAGERLP